MSKPAYRADLDGIRAIAVMAVVLVHAGAQFVPGGYVGVDVFFVLSGYLISTLILTDIDADQFSFKRFYLRRARRLLPAMIVVLLACIPFAFLWMLPSQLVNFAWSVLSVLTLSANFYLWSEVNYFQLSADYVPLLHMWSLSVEEQFYLLFPVLLVGLAPFLGRFMVMFWIGVGLASLALAVFGSQFFASASFYLLPTRMWELLAGVLCAYAMRSRPDMRHEGIALIGVLLILWPIFTLDVHSLNPSYFAIIPVIGTMLVILFGQRQTLVARVLSLRPLVLIGVSSYATYLWHQPILAFARLRFLTDPSPLLIGVCIVLAFALGWLTWRLVEAPIRMRAPATDISHARAFGILGTMTACSLAFCIAVVATAGLPERRGAEQGISKAAEIQNQTQWNTGFGLACSDVDRTLDDCSTSPDPKVMVWGDSFAMHLVDGVLVSDPEVDLVQVTKAVCGPILDLAPMWEASGPAWSRECLDHNAAVFELIASLPSLETVVLSTSVGSYTHPKLLTYDGLEWAHGSIDRTATAMAQTAQKVEDLGLSVVFVAPPPMPNYDVSKCLAQADWLDQDLSLCDFAQSSWPPRLLRNYEVMRRLDANFKVVWLSDMMCADGTCPAHYNGTYYYQDDGGHLTVEGSRLLGVRGNLLGRIQSAE